jgi:hypothetical protein
MLALASAVILRSESRGTHDYILLSQIRDFPNLEDQIPLFISPRKRVAQLYPQAPGSLFVASYYSQGYGGGFGPRLHMGFIPQLAWDPCYTASGRPEQKIPFRNNSSIVIEICLPRRCIETAVVRLVLAYSFPWQCFYRAVA